MMPNILLPNRLAMWRATRIRSRQGGFTLLEILVALAIFSIAAAIAYKGLDAVIASKQAMEREIRFWRETGQVFERMEMDFTQIAPRAWQTTPNSYLPPLQGEVTEREGFYVELSRSDDERAQARLGLQKLPRNANPTRQRARCEMTGRPRGTFRQFGLGRAKIRELAFEGQIPGVTKASW